ncbi:MAG: hypothetical protein ABI683_15410 [Ginsengibacter sp.]
MKSVEEVVEIKQSVEKEIMSMKGVTGIDVGYKYKNGRRTSEVSIRVHVAKKMKTVPKGQSIPKEIEGVSTDVLQDVFEPQWLKVKEDEVIAFADVASYSPLIGGISIGPDRVIGGYVYVGTLGAPVIDKTNNKTVMLSNFHVMCVDTNWSVGDIMDQPGRVDGGTIANRVGTLKRSSLSAHVDGAISAIDAGKTTKCQIKDIGNIKGTASAVLNAPVRKRGRTTLLTYGFVDAINATLSVDYGPGLGTKTFTNQIGVRPDVSHNPKFSDHGDSGSVVVDANNKVVGLLFAGNSSGYTYMNPINFVLSELNIKLCTATVVKPTKEFKEFKNEKNEKIEIKEAKHEKIEFKEYKIEKLEHKEFKDGKSEFELPKLIETKIPGIGFTSATGAGDSDVEQRLAAIEAALGEMSAFISQNIRPDLSHGAYTNEEE